MFKLLVLLFIITLYARNNIFKYYLHVYIKYASNCAYKVANTEMIDYLDDNLFESDKNQFFDLINGS